MADITTSCLISRTLNGSLELNDSANGLFLAADFSEGMETYRDITATTPWTDGDYYIHRTPQMTDMKVAVYVAGSNEAEFQTRLNEVLAAFAQEDFTITLVLGGQTIGTYNCKRASWTPRWTNTSFGALKMLIEFTVPRWPGRLTEPAAREPAAVAGIEPPTSATTTETDASTNGTSINLVLGPPSAVVEGELMVAVVAFQHDAGGSPAITWDAAWTEASSLNAGVGTGRGKCAVAYKTASADDESGSSSYTHTVSADTSSAMAASAFCTHIGNGSLSAPVTDQDWQPSNDPANSSVSAAPPAGPWTLAVLTLIQQGLGGATVLSFGLDTGGQTLTKSNTATYSRGQHKIAMYPQGISPIAASASIDRISGSGSDHDLYLHLFAVEE